MWFWFFKIYSSMFSDKETVYFADVPYVFMKNAFSPLDRWSVL